MSSQEGSMIRVRIRDAERELSSVSESWINQQINRRGADGQSVCRPPNRYEEQVFNLWKKRGLNQEQFTGGNLIAFLKQLRS